MAPFMALSPLVTVGQGQQGSGSPYSAYGLGDMLGNPQVSQALMGGAGVAIADPFSVNMVNPASYASLGAAVFEVGGMGRYRHFETTDANAKGRRYDLLGFSIGAPFDRYRMGLAFGLNPMSQVGYNITDRATIANGDEVRFDYSGQGGLNKVFFGLARKIQLSKDSLGRGAQLSIGANVNYLFGQIDEVRKVYYPRSLDYYNAAVFSSLVLRAPMVNAGTQLTGTLLNEAKVRSRIQVRKERLMQKDKAELAAWEAKGLEPEDRKPVRIPKREGEALRYRLGLSSELPMDLDAYRDLLAYSFIQGNLGLEFPVDTVLDEQGLSGRLGIPVQLGLGFTVFNSRWTLTLEHKYRDWKRLTSNVENLDLNEQLGTSNTTTLGASYRPAGYGNGSLAENIIYRAGFRYSDDYLVIGTQQLVKYGMAFGISLPITGLTTRSRLSFGAEFGEQGTTEEGLIRERYTNLYIGITITPDLRERWLQKRRFE